MLRHAWPDYFGGGGVVGVAVFFALSGYLITQVLDRDIAIGGRPRFGRFYLHRAFRLYPALLLLVAVSAVVIIKITHQVPLQHVLIAVRNSLLYLTDLPPFFATDLPISHLWTLAIEEQFYLVWPVVLWLAYLVTRKLGRVAIVATILLTALCVLSLILSTKPSDIYMLVSTWASVIAFGGVGYFYRDRIRALIGRASGGLAIAALVVLLAMTFYPDAKDHRLTYALGPTVIAVCAVLIINWATTEGRDEVRAPAVKPLLWLGRISYGAYLWNLPMTEWWNRFRGSTTGWAEVMTIPLTIGAAVISWYTVEAVGRALRARVDTRWRKRQTLES